MGACLALAFCLGCVTGPDAREQARAKAEYHYKLGNGYYGESNFGGALAELTRALELAPDHGQSHNLLGLVFMARREFYEALDHLKRAAVLRPKDLGTRNNLGVAYLALCRWKEAADLYDDLVRQPLYATPWVAHNNLGWALWKQERRSDAIGHFRKAVFFNPSFCVAYNNLGLAYLEEARYDEAEGALRQALSAEPTCGLSYAEPHLHLARLRVRQDRGDEACAELATCLRKAPPGAEQVAAGCGQSPSGTKCERRARELGCTPDGRGGMRAR